MSCEHYKIDGLTKEEYDFVTKCLRSKREKRIVAVEMCAAAYDAMNHFIEAGGQIKFYNGYGYGILCHASDEPYCQDP